MSEIINNVNDLTILFKHDVLIEFYNKRKICIMVMKALLSIENICKKENNIISFTDSDYNSVKFYSINMINKDLLSDRKVALLIFKCLNRLKELFILLYTSNFQKHIITEIYKNSDDDTTFLHNQSTKDEMLELLYILIKDNDISNEPTEICKSKNGLTINDILIKY